MAGKIPDQVRNDGGGQIAQYHERSCCRAATRSGSVVVSGLVRGFGDLAKKSADKKPGERISSPRKVRRITETLRQVLSELRTGDLPEGTLPELLKLKSNSLKKLNACLSPDLRNELAELIKPFQHRKDSDAPLTLVELRILLAELVGWLDGLLFGVDSVIAAGAGGAGVAGGKAALIAVGSGTTTVKATASGENGELNAEPNGTDPRPGQYL